MNQYIECRGAREIGERALMVGFFLSLFKPQGLDAFDPKTLVAAAGRSYVKSDEEILQQPSWSPEFVQKMFWQAECLGQLLWALKRLPTAPPIGEQFPSDLVIAEMNAMGRDPARWLASLERRSEKELDAVNEWLTLWLWRTRADGPPSRGLPGNIREAVRDALDRGVVTADHVRSDDLVACGRPFFKLNEAQRTDVTLIVEERARAVFWIWRDFDDWWEPVLDS